MTTMPVTDVSTTHGMTRLVTVSVVVMVVKKNRGDLVQNMARHKIALLINYL